MKPTTPALLLLSGTPLSLAAPAQENQIVLGHSTPPTALTAVPTITTTRPRATATPTPLWKMTSRTPSSAPTPTPVAKAVWDWLFHPHPPNRAVRPKGEGCFCAGGATCCYRPDEEIVCGFGVC